MITHNEIVTGLGALLVAVSYLLGLLSGHWWWPSRQRLRDEHDDGYSQAVKHAFHRVEEGRVLRLSPDGIPSWCDAGSQWDRSGANCYVGFDDPPMPPGRHTVVLEPGRTTYPALVALAEEAIDGPVRHAEPITSTWYRTTWLDLERRYPIPLDSPNGRMTEAV